jgi:hypothetical protein
MTTNAAELAKAAAELVAETTKDAGEEDLAKSLVDIIDRLVKSDGFGNAADAHNGNKLNHSAPMGSGDVPSGYASTAAEEGVQDAARIKASSKVKTAIAGTPTTLTKGEGDEDDDKDKDDKDKDDKDKPFFAKKDDKDKDDDKDDDGGNPFAKKSADALTEEKVQKALVSGDAGEEVAELVESSDAIAYIADTMAKAFAFVSAQIASLSEEVHGRLDEQDGLLGLTIDANATIAKSLLASVREGKLAKSYASQEQPVSGLVVVNTGDAAAAKTAVSADPKTNKGALTKSLAKAINTGTLTDSQGALIMARLDTQDIASVWGTLSEEVRNAIAGASN